MNAYKVVRHMPGADAFRCAVATIIEDIERDTKKPLWWIAESIDVSLGTLSNAKNKKASLSAEFLARIGAVYGPAYLNPYLKLFGAQAAPIEKKPARDIHPVIARLSHKLAMASDPEGPGGPTHVPQEKAGYLPDLKEANRETGCKIAEIEEALA